MHTSVSRSACQLVCIATLLLQCKPLLLQEVVLGLQEVLHGCVSERQAKHLLTLAEFPHQTKANLRLFAALCCLAERVFSVHLL